MMSSTTNKNRSAFSFILHCVLLSLVFFSFFVLTTTASSVNQEINYQGKLTNSEGSGVADGDYHMRFRLYDVADEGTPLWEEERTNGDRVSIEGGLFSILLGEVESLDVVDFNQTLYLAVEVGGSDASPDWDGEMTPRKKLGTVPAAFEAVRLSGLESSQFLRSDEADTKEADSSDTLLTINQLGTGSILNLQQDSNTLFTVGNDGNVGVGTDAPEDRLTVAGGTIRQAAHDPVLRSTLVDSVNLDTPQGIDVQGRYAYVTGKESNSLSVIDISDPDNPTRISTVVDNTNMQYASSVVVSGRYAYVVSHSSDSLTVIDVSNPNNPTVVGVVSDGTDLNNPWDLKVVGSYAYVGTRGGDGITVIDISDPEDPTIVGVIIDSPVMDRVRGVDVQGDYVYTAAWWSDSVAVVDISDPTNPTVVGDVVDSVELEGVWSITVSGRYAYVSTVYAESLVVIDISDPTDPTIVGSVSDPSLMSYGRHVVHAGDYVYLAGTNSNAVSVIDVSNPTSPEVAGSLTDATDLNGATRIALVGNYAYVVNKDADSLAVLDISGIHAPSASIGNINADSIAVGGNVTARNLSLSTSLNVGGGGILSQGPLFVDNSGYFSGNLGLGTTTPTHQFTQQGLLNDELTGTVSVTENSSTVTGDGTSFTTELAEGDAIKIEDETFTVDTITSDTELTLDSDYLGTTDSGLPAYRDPHFMNIASGAGIDRFTVNRTGDVSIDGNFSITGDTTFNTISYSWPGADGSDGYALTTDGAGGLSWSDVGGGGGISGSGSSNQLAFWSDSSTMTGSSNLVWNGNLLDVEGDLSIGGELDVTEKLTSRDILSLGTKIEDISPSSLATITDHTATVNSVYAYNNLIASGADDNNIRIYDITDPANPVHQATITDHTDNVNSVHIQGNLLASGSHDNDIRIYDITDPENPVHQATVTDHTDLVFTVHMKDNLLASGSRDNDIRIYDISDPANPAHQTTITDHTNNVKSVHMKDNLLVSGSRDNDIRIYDISDPANPAHQTTITDHTDFVFSVYIENNLLVSGSRDNDIRIYDISDSTNPVHQTTITDHTSNVNSVYVHNNLLASGSSDDDIRIYDITDPENPVLQATITDHTGSVFSVQVHNNILVSGALDNDIRIYELGSEKSTDRFFVGHYGVGIGTQSPAHTLDVAGSFGVSGTTTLNSNLTLGTTTPTHQFTQQGLLNDELTGTVSVTENSSTVTGDGTSFTTELAEGDAIKIEDETFTVDTITSDTELTLDSDYLGTTDSGLPAYRDPHFMNIASGAGIDRFTVSRTGDVSIDGNFSITGDTTFNTVSYSWPGADGSDGHALTTDGAGNLSWTDIGASVTGSGSANQLAFWDGEDSITGGAGLTWNTSTLTIDGNVSILNDGELHFGDNIIMGSGTTVRGGVGHVVAGENAVVGNDGAGAGNYHIAIGFGATTGVDTSSDKHGLIAIGEGANVSHTFTQDSIAIGRNANTNQDRSIVIGTDATVHGNSGVGAPGGVAIGHLAAAGRNSIAIGRGATLSDISGLTVVGTNASAHTGSASAFGSEADASGGGSLALGAFSEASSLGSIALGRSAHSAHQGSIALGTGAETTSLNQFVVGGIDDDTDVQPIHELLLGVGPDRPPLIFANQSGLGLGTTTPTHQLTTQGLLNDELTGTVSVTENSPTVTGDGTSFTTELNVGDAIKIETETFTVDTITSDTELTLDSDYLGTTDSGLSAYRDPHFLNIASGDAVDMFTFTRSGRLGIGTSTPNDRLHVDGNILIDSDTNEFQIAGHHALSLPIDGFHTVAGRGAGSSWTGFDPEHSENDLILHNGTFYRAKTTTSLEPGVDTGWEDDWDNLGSNMRQSAFGYSAGQNNTGNIQSAFGYFAGLDNTGDFQSAFGYFAGRDNTGDFQSAFGYFAGRDNEGHRVTGVGYEATRGNTGDDVVALGYQAGLDNTTSNQFIVQQANVNATPLIQGDFSTGRVGIGTTTLSDTLTVDGSLSVSGTTTFNTVSYSWPGADGSDGYALTTDGAGNLSWTDIGASVTGSGSANQLAFWSDSSTIDGSADINTTGLYLDPDTIPSGSGTRLLWHPTKGAFRAGQVSGTQWNDANIGDYSFAVGQNTEAGENFAVAMGEDTTASGFHSFAMGVGSEAIGHQSFAMGLGVEASGFRSVAMGEETISGGYASFAMGWETEANDSYSVAFGYGTTASGEGSFAMGSAFGNTTEASGNNSVAWGTNVIAGPNNRTFAFGDGFTNNTANSFAIGFGQKDFSVEGGQTDVFGDLSVSDGLAVSGLTGTSSFELVRYDTSTGDFYYDSSSERYKSEIETYETDFYSILSIEPKIFTDNTSGERLIGYIAEDLDEAGLDNLVFYRENDEGELVPDGLRYDKVSIYMGEVLRDQNERLLELELLIGEVDLEGDRPSLADRIKSVFEEITGTVRAGGQWVFESLAVGSSDDPTGITLFDTETGDPYCIEMRGGEMVHIPGECGDPQGESSSSGSSTSTSASTIDPDDNAGDKEEEDDKEDPQVAEDESKKDEGGEEEVDITEGEEKEKESEESDSVKGEKEGEESLEHESEPEGDDDENVGDDMQSDDGSDEHGGNDDDLGGDEEGDGVSDDDPSERDAEEESAGAEEE